MRRDWSTEAQELSDAAQLRVIRRGLGLTGEQLADKLSVDARTVRRWEAGSPIPKGVWVELDDLVSLHDRHVAEGVPDDEQWPEGWRESVRWRLMAAPRFICTISPDRYPGMWMVDITAVEHLPMDTLDRLDEGASVHESLDAFLDDPAGRRVTEWQEIDGRRVLRIDGFASRDDAEVFTGAFTADTGTNLQARRDRALEAAGFQV